MTCRDLVRFIRKYKLEDAEMKYYEGRDMDILFYVKIPKTPASDERELIYSFNEHKIYEKYISIKEISYAEAFELRGLTEKEDSHPYRCINCIFFDKYSYHIDNTVDISAVAVGSCGKCERNFTTSDPYNEVPSWCPMKGDKE